MYINNEAYGLCSDLEYITKFRSLLKNYVYPVSAVTDQLIAAMSRSIESLNVEFNPQYNSVTFKIKKTAMKRNSSFHHNASYYYPIIGRAFSQVLNENKRLLIDILAGCVGIKESCTIVDTITKFPDEMLASLCDVGCISDNIISISF